MPHFAEYYDQAAPPPPDLRNTSTLRHTSAADLCNDVSHTTHRTDDVPHGLPGPINQPSTALHTPNRIPDQFLDLFGRLCTAARQGPHLSSDNRKTTPLLTRTSRFHSRVQSQDIRLKRNPVDGADDVSDTQRTILDAAHHHHDIIHNRAATAGHSTGVLRQLIGLLCMLGVLPYRNAQGIHVRCRLHQ